MFIHYLVSVLGSSLIEQIAAIISLSAIILTVMQRNSSWILDIISSIIYGFVFYTAGFYSDSLLQAVFISMSIYGWFSWAGKQAGRPVLTIRNSSRNENYLALLLLVTLTVIGGYIFTNFVRGAAYAYTDSFCTALSIVATWLTARKIIQNWYLWILADLIYINLFCLKHLYPTAILYSVLVILAVTGLNSWKKIEKKCA